MSSNALAKKMVSKSTSKITKKRLAMAAAGAAGAAGGGLSLRHFLKKRKKTASADAAFDADMNRMMGIEPTAQTDFERPDVSTNDPTVDKIDAHFLGWMQKKASEDVVKVAECEHKGMKEGAKCEKCGEMVKKASRSDAFKRILTGGEKTLSKELLKAKLKGAAAGAGAVGAAVGGKALYDKGARDARKKHAGVVEHDENLDLLARIRKRAANGQGISNDA